GGRGGKMVLKGKGERGRGGGGSGEEGQAARRSIDGIAEATGPGLDCAVWFDERGQIGETSTARGVSLCRRRQRLQRLHDPGSQRGSVLEGTVHLRAPGTVVGLLGQQIAAGRSQGSSHLFGWRRSRWGRRALLGAAAAQPRGGCAHSDADSPEPSLDG